MNLIIGSAKQKCVMTIMSKLEIYKIIKLNLLLEHNLNFYIPKKQIKVNKMIF